MYIHDIHTHYVLFVLCAGMRKSVHGNFDMGSIFSSRPSPDRSGFSPLTAQEDHYTESEDEEDGVYEKKQILKH